jgi:hypothetical protein
VPSSFFQLSHHASLKDGAVEAHLALRYRSYINSALIISLWSMGELNIYTNSTQRLPYACQCRVEMKLPTMQLRKPDMETW